MDTSHKRTWTPISKSTIKRTVDQVEEKMAKLREFAGFKVRHQLSNETFTVITNFVHEQEFYR